MFTGIIEEVGTVVDVRRGDGHASVTIRAEVVTASVALGESVAVDGCCLTVAAVDGHDVVADMMAETLRATALGDLAAGDTVNLERAMPADGRFGGHVVQGHVDAVGQVTARVDEPGTTWVDVHAPAAVARYLVPKGSITMAGASLTVVHVVDHDDATATFRVGLIPHTLAHTTFGRLATGTRVNLEADVVGKYVERLVAVHVDHTLGSRAPAGGDPDLASPAPTATDQPDDGSTT